MNLSPRLESRYTADRQSAAEAQELAHRIAFGPIVFQVSRLMLKFGVLPLLCERPKGATLEELAEETGLSRYALKILLEASLSIGTVKIDSADRYMASKAGWFLAHDPMIRANIDFNHDVNYLGMFYLEDALLRGAPQGLKVFGEWPTIYAGLSQLPERVKESWFGFDHYYSDASFDDALEIVFGGVPPCRLLDVGGNTGRWALRCVDRDPQVEVTVVDLPGQLDMLRRATEGKAAAGRIRAYAADVLDSRTCFPEGFDAIWMSQFLDCFSEEQIVSILSRASAAMEPGARLYIMETLWDRQTYETAAFCLTLTSPYFTAMANGNSKMYSSGDLVRCIEAAGLRVERIFDGLGMGHSIVVCTK